MIVVIIQYIDFKINVKIKYHSNALTEHLTNERYIK